MIVALYKLPDWAIIAMSAAILGLIMAFVPKLVQRMPFMRPSPEKTDFVLRIQSTLFTMGSLVIAFTLVEAQSNYRKVDALVSAEASQIDQLDRLLTRMNSPVADAARKPLHDYAQSIVNDEWPEMAKGLTSDKTREAFGPVSRGVFVIDPLSNRQSLIYAEMLKSVDAVAQSRDARINSLYLYLPSAYWQVVLFALTIVVFVSSAVEQTTFRRVVLAAQTSVIGAFFGFVFVMDSPYSGDGAITPYELVRVIANMDHRM